MNLTDRLITEIVEKCDGLSITAEQASNILAYLQYGAPLPREAATGDREFHEAAVKLVRDMMNFIPSFSAPSDLLARINALLTSPLPAAPAADTEHAWRSWQARAASTSANVAHVTERDAVLLEAAAIASTHCSRCAALIKARMGSANVAQPIHTIGGVPVDHSDDVSITREEYENLLRMVTNVAQGAEAYQLLAALIDIHDDAQNTAPEDRCYVEGAWNEAWDEARALTAAQSARASEGKDGRA